MYYVQVVTSEDVLFFREDDSSLVTLRWQATKYDTADAIASAVKKARALWPNAFVQWKRVT